MARKEAETVRGVYEYPKGSGVWWIHYYDHGRRHRERIGPRKLAIAVREKRRTEIREGRYFPPTRRRAALFDDLLENYRKAKDREGKSIMGTAICFQRLLEQFGGRRADSIEPADTEVWRDALRSTLSAATVNRHLALLRAILLWGVRNRSLGRDAVPEIRLLRENNRRVRCLADDEEARLMRKLPARLRPLVVLALNTGMRRGELLGLRWKDIDLVNRTITIREAKSGEGRRLPINAQAYEALSRLRRERIREQEAGADLAAFRESAVFAPSPAAMVMALKRHFGRALGAAKIEDFHFHDLRHTFASRLAMSNFNLPTIAELLGHKTLAMTARYSHLLPDHLAHAVGSLDRRRVKAGPGAAVKRSANSR
ncbi:MAG: tyrosine-type recombinase/integrase [Candidatus Binatales bacterium]